MGRREEDMDQRRPPAGVDGTPAGSRLPLWVPALYAFVAVSWIAFSDAFLAAVVPSAQFAWWSTVKGVVFVAVTTAVLHAGLRWTLARERRAEGAARSAERRYDLIAEHARDVILLIRRTDGRILEANAAAAAAYGWSREELRGMTIVDLRTPASAPLLAEQMSAADAGGFRFETVHRRRDGSAFPVEVSSQGVMLDGERVLVSVVRE